MSEAPEATWDRVLGSWSPGSPHARLRPYADAVNSRLVERWLGARRFDTALKTDCFDEAVGVGLLPALTARAERVLAVDTSAEIVTAARQRYPQLDARQMDVRNVHAELGAVDLIVSNSTLDHFDDPAELREAIAELAAALRPGGTLLITLDNPLNPLVALRNRIPRLLRRLGAIPYDVGRTVGPRSLRRLLEANGLVVVRTGAMMHVPRPFAILVLWLARVGGESFVVRPLVGCERLDVLPTRYLTGQFVAALAVKPER